MNLDAFSTFMAASPRDALSYGHLFLLLLWGGLIAISVVLRLVVADRKRNLQAALDMAAGAPATG